MSPAGIASTAAPLLDVLIAVNPVFEVENDSYPVLTNPPSTPLTNFSRVPL